MMAVTLDQTSDTTRQDMHRCAQLYDFPDYVKQAAPAAVLEVEPKLASTAFADVRNRQFKCSNKAATWVSYLFFLEKSSALHPKIAGFIHERLDAFANSWGIVPDIKALREKHAELQKNAMSDSSYMQVWASEDGTKVREYPLRNPMEVKVASEWFMQNRDHFMYNDRRTMATKLLEKANEFGVGLDPEIDDELEKQAGRGTYDPKTAAQHIRNRITATDAPADCRAEMTKLADAVQANPELATDTERIAQLCVTVDTFDRMTKLSEYTELIPRPEDIFCAATFKTARAAVDECCTMLTGTVYHQSDLQKVALNSIRSAFGNDIAEAVSNGLNVDPVKLAEVASTFPRPDAVLFDRVLADSGILPMMKQATAVRGPNFQELQGLAHINQFINDLPERNQVRLGS